jgi:hypothetical protein
MEKSIFELIMNAGGLALALAILFYYSYKSFNLSSSERKELKTELSALQKDFHNFKNQMIDKLVTLSTETKLSIDNLTDSLEKRNRYKT